MLDRLQNVNTLYKIAFLETYNDNKNFGKNFKWEGTDHTMKMILSDYLEKRWG